MATASKSSRITPAEGLAFLTSAMTRRVSLGARQRGEKIARGWCVQCTPLELFNRLVLLRLGDLGPLVFDDLIKDSAQGQHTVRGKRNAATPTLGTSLT